MHGRRHSCVNQVNESENQVRFLMPLAGHIPFHTSPNHSYDSLGSLELRGHSPKGTWPDIPATRSKSYAGIP